MRVIIDAEFDSLTPTKVWCIVCKDIDTGERYVFRFEEGAGFTSFIRFSWGVTQWVGVNNLVFDGPNLNYLLGAATVVPSDKCLDLLIISRLVWYSRPGGHSVEAWSKRFGMHKPEIKVYDDPSMIDEYVHRCEEDVEIQHRIYLDLKRFIDDPAWAKAIECEHEVQRICMDMHENGFSFDKDQADELLATITTEMTEMEARIQETVLPVLVQGGEVTLKRNKDGQPSASTQGFTRDDNHRGVDGSFISGTVLHRFSYTPFNPGSAKHRVELLNKSGWKPVNKTKGRIECERALQRTPRFKVVERKKLEDRLEKYKLTGWKVDEENLITLPVGAPEGAHILAAWLTLEGRRSDLSEWLVAYREHSGRIHGTFNGLGSWTGRMSHVRPNQGNIFSVFTEAQCKDSGWPTRVEDVKLRYNGVLRGLWRAEPGAYLVGADAEGVQLRVFAHYVDDPAYTKAIAEGRKENKTDVHNVNRNLLGGVCNSRDDAKTFIYAWLLGAGTGKVAQILQCKPKQATNAVRLFVSSIPGLEELRSVKIPFDAQRGFFDGFDGRKVVCTSEHLMLAGYLQNGESTIMKHANILWRKWAAEEDIRFKQVDFVHDEWQSEAYTLEEAHRLGSLKCDAIIATGKELELRCPLAGEYKIGRNWMETH